MTKACMLRETLQMPYRITRTTPLLLDLLYHCQLDEVTCWERWEKRHSGLESGVMTDCDSHVQPASRIYTIHSRHSDEHEHPCF